MTRSKSLTAAAILQLLLSLADAIGSLPILARGSNPPPNGPPFWAGVFFIITAVAGMFGAYGLWKNQRWGKILTLIQRVILGFFALGDIYALFVVRRSEAMIGLQILSISYIFMSILVIYLVLRRERQLALA